MSQGGQVERRIVSVLFADLVGFTSLSERLDAEDVAALQDAYFAVVRETVGRYGGRLEKFIGDAAMAVFGIPRTREDDAERAVRAGLALAAAVEALGARLGLEGGGLVLRVGINTGEVAHAVAGLDEDRVTGDTVNVAARLQTAADPGHVLVGESTALAVADAIEVGSRIDLELKGKTGRFGARQVVGPRPERSRDDAMGALRAPTQGRETELAAIGEALERAIAGGVERWTIIAPPGVGKTRLVGELERRAHDVSAGPRAPVVWRVRSRADEVGSYAAVAALLRLALDGNDPGQVDLGGTAQPTERLAVLRAELAQLVGPEVSGATPTERLSDARAERFEAWLDVLDALASGRSQVWIVEDVHWAGGDLLAFLSRAGIRAAPSGRLVVATARPALLERDPAWPETDGGRRLDLSPLAHDDATALIRALVGDALSVELAAAVATRGDGNPLFIEELLRSWVSVGTLVRGETGAWRITIDPHEVPLPATVQTIYAAQLDDLPEEARAVARRGSVAGRRIPYRALGELGVSGGAAERGVRVLHDRALLAGPEAEPVAGDVYSYRHALLRDAGYASLARADRARLHIRLARWLEDVAGGRVLAVAELIARHYATAVTSASAFALELDEGLDRTTVSRLAASWLDTAAEQSLRLAAHDAAAALLRDAIELTPAEDGLERARRLTKLGGVIGHSGDTDAAMASFEEARTIAAERLASPGDDATVARRAFSHASAAAAQLLLEQLRFRDGTALARDAIELIGETDDPDSARLVLARAKGEYFESNAPGPLLEATKWILATARAHGDDDLELDALHEWTNLQAEQVGAGAQVYDELLGLARSREHWQLVVSCLINRADLWPDERRDDMVVELDEAERIAIGHGLTESRAWIWMRRAESAMLGGSWDEALAAGDEGLAVGTANGYVRACVRTWFAVRPIIGYRRDLARARRMAEWFDALPSVPDSPYGRLMQAAVDVDLAELVGRPLVAPDLDRLGDGFGLFYDDISMVAARDRVLDAWSAEGDVERVRAANDLVRGILGPLSGSLNAGSERYWTAWLLAEAGDGNDAEAAARDALGRFRQADAAWWTARAIALLADRLDRATAAERRERTSIEARLRGADA